MQAAVLETDVTTNTAEFSFTVEHGDLARALGHGQGVVERRNTIPILGNVLLQTVGGELSISSTDMDLEFSENIPAQGVQNGATTVPVHTLYDIVRKLPGGSQIMFEAGETQVTLKCGRSKFKLPCLPASDFPSFSMDDYDATFTIAAQGLKRLLDRTKFSMSVEETRFFLNGIFFHREGGNLRAVTTDGHRLAKSELPVEQLPENLPGIIVPRKTVLELRKLLDDSKDPNEAVTVSCSSTRIRFQFGALQLVSKLIDGTFPDYTKVIPTNNDKFLLADAAVFAEAADRVATISAEKTRSIKAAVSGGKMVLMAQGADAGQAQEEIEIQYDGEDINLGFNARFLLDVLGQIEAEQCRVSFNSGNTPVLIQAEGEPGDLFVIMPMRV